jgi:hypothetical protein
VDVGTGQLDVPHHHPGQVDGAEPGTGQVDGTELRAAEVNVLEPGATQIGTDEVSHATPLMSRAGEPRGRGDGGLCRAGR